MATNVDAFVHLPIDLGVTPTPAPKSQPAQGAFREHLVERRPAPATEENTDTRDLEPPSARAKLEYAPHEASDVADVQKNDAPVVAVANVTEKVDHELTDELVDDEGSDELLLLIDHGGIHAFDEVPPTESDETATVDVDLSPEVDEAETGKTIVQPEVPPSDETTENNEAAVSTKATSETTPAEVDAVPAVEPPKTIVPESKVGDVPAAPEATEAQADEDGDAKPTTKVVAVTADEEAAVADTPLPEQTTAKVAPAKKRTETESTKPQDNPNVANPISVPASSSTATQVARDDGDGKQKRVREVATPQVAIGPGSGSEIVPRIELANRLLQEAAAVLIDDQPDEAIVADASQSNDKEPLTAKPTTSNSENVTAISAKPASGEQRLSSLLGGRTTEPRQTQPISDVQQARIVQRVAKAFDVARTRGESVVRLRLSPPELGSLRVELQVESGSLIAKLEVETQATREIVLDNLNALRQRLADQNIRVDQFDVDLLDRQTEDPRDQADRQPQDRSASEQRRSTRQDGHEIVTPKTQTQRVERLLDEGVIDVTI